MEPWGEGASFKLPQGHAGGDTASPEGSESKTGIKEDSS